MLSGLFGNQNVERILLFLFVNEQCYGTQIQSLLGVPLTPIQKGLQRLEKEGIINSHYEGKTRVYQFSHTYPFRFELEMLLKKAYTLLHSQEKKQYCFIHKVRGDLKSNRLSDRNKREDLLKFWEKLRKVKHLSFHVKSRQKEEQSVKIGKADIVVQMPSPSVLIFEEKGYWLLDHQADTAFSNSFRWTMDLNALLISLEHLRYGTTHPVFLFHLTPTQSQFLKAVDEHLCGEDTYLGNIFWNQNEIAFHWRTIGPNKNSQLTYHYSF